MGASSATALAALKIGGRVAYERLVRPKARQHDDVPCSPDAITTEWLTAVLCDKVPGAMVTEVEVKRASAGTHERHRLVLTYNEQGGRAGLPGSMFTKSLPSVVTRMIGGFNGTARAEGRFYMQLRPQLGIEAPVGRPAREHPKRPVEGFACPRNEVSGARLWGAIAERFRTPERFFRRHFVANLCPLLFLEASGRNRTPDKLPEAERRALLAACLRHLRRLVELLEPEWVVGVGGFAADHAREALAGSSVRVARILHPSPANPRAGAQWGLRARRELLDQGVCPG